MRVFLRYLALLLPAVAFAGSLQSWHPVPAHLWAYQAVTPPGTNTTTPNTPPPAQGSKPPQTDPKPSQPGSGVAPATGVVPIVPGGAGPVTGSPSPTSNSGSVPVAPAGTRTPMPPGFPEGPGFNPTAGSTAPRGVPMSRPPGANAPPNGAPATAVPNTSTATPTAASANGVGARTNLPPCEVRLSVARTDLPFSGGAFYLPVDRTPADCVPSIAQSAPWLRILEPAKLTVAAEPNVTVDVRETMVMIGSMSLLVRQEPGPRPDFAAAPSSLVFAIKKSGKSERRTLSTWSASGSESFIAKADVPWLIVTPKKSKAGRQVYDVTIGARSGLRPGRYDTHIAISSAGTPSRVLMVPVVVEVEGLR